MLLDPCGTICMAMDSIVWSDPCVLVERQALEHPLAHSWLACISSMTMCALRTPISPFEQQSRHTNANRWKGDLPYLDHLHRLSVPRNYYIIISPKF